MCVGGRRISGAPGKNVNRKRSPIFFGAVKVGRIDQIDHDLDQIDQIDRDLYRLVPDLPLCEGCAGSTYVVQIQTRKICARRSLRITRVPPTRRVVNRKPQVFFFGRFLSVFPDRKLTFFSRFFRLFLVGFSVAPKKRNRKTSSVFFGRFFFLSPTPITPTCMYGNPIMFGQPSGPHRQQHAAEQHVTGMTFFFI